MNLGALDGFVGDESSFWSTWSPNRTLTLPEKLNGEPFPRYLASQNGNGQEQD